MQKKELLLAASNWFPKASRHYTFEPQHISGSTLTDLSGNQSATISGSPQFVSGFKGNAVKFTGNSADFINIGRMDFIHQTCVFTIAFRAKTAYTDSGEAMVLLGSSVVTSTGGFAIFFEDRASAAANRAVRFMLTRVSGSGYAMDYKFNDVLPTDGEYHHYAIVGVGTGIECYVDGAKVGEATLSYALSKDTAAANCYIGRASNATTSTYRGELDELYITPKSLTAQQIKRLYQTGQ